MKEKSNILFTSHYLTINTFYIIIIFIVRRTLSILLVNVQCYNRISTYNLFDVNYIVYHYADVGIAIIGILLFVMVIVFLFVVILFSYIGRIFIAHLTCSFRSCFVRYFERQNVSMCQWISISFTTFFYTQSFSTCTRIPM